MAALIFANGGGLVFEGAKMANRKTDYPLTDLWEKVRAKCVENETGCLEWQGAKNAQGYGVMWANGRQVGTHRIALATALNDETIIQKITNPKGRVASIYALHSCDNPACCNPAHLRLGSQKDNADDATARNRRPAYIAALPRKLTDEAVREIRAKAGTWDGMCDMMKKYKVGQLAIEAAYSGKSYKHVTD